MLADTAGVGDAQIGVACFWVHPSVDAGDSIGLKLPGGFFESLADYCGQQAFSVFQVARGLVEDGSATLLFLDHEELTLVFDDGGYGDAGRPSRGRF